MATLKTSWPLSVREVRYTSRFKRDHALTGEWCDHRDCHLKPDLVLIYSTAKDGFLDLVRLGAHSELGI